MIPKLLLFIIIAVTVGNLDSNFRSKLYYSKILRLPPKEYIAVNSPKTKIGHNSNITPYIDGGTEVNPPHKYPFFVSITIDYAYLCNGALLSNEWVLTLAHCLVGAHDANVVLGEHDRDAFEDTEENFYSSQFIIHENYDNSTLENDIALIRFQTPINLTNAINSVTLPNINDGDLEEGTEVTIVGWGGESANLGYEVNVPTITNAECGNVYGSEVQEGKLCTSHNNGGAYNWDIGSPVVYEAPNGPQLRGLVSSVSRIDGRYPDVHTRITHYLDWIHEKTGL